MWQTVIVILILVGVSVYLVRYFLRVYRTETSPCGGCTGCCSHGPADPDKPDLMEQAPLNLTCPDGKAHGHEDRA